MISAPACRRRLELEPDESAETLAHVGHDFGWSLCRKLDAPGVPIEVLDVIRKDDAGDSATPGATPGATADECHFKRVALRVARNWTGNDQARFHVVRARRQDQSGPTAALLMPRLWIERQPHQIASVRDVRAGYHTS